MTRPAAIGLDWPLTTITGWGVVGVHLAIAMCRSPGPRPVLFRNPEMVEVDPLRRRVLAPLLKKAEEFAETFPRGQRPLVKAAFPVLHALTRKLGGQPELPAEGRPDIGLAVIEDTRLTDVGRENAKRYARIVAASRWVADVLRSEGVEDAAVVQQGIDPSLFHPGPQLRPFGDRFVIFSGGKIEFRKGQDLVVAAFRRFHARHPEAFLVTCWQNAWPESAASIVASGIARRPPRKRDGLGIDVDEWMAGMGVPAGSCMDVDFVPNGMMPPVIREADVALFPNRCEGGTNLVAMECLAAGVPTILSANTGHLDLLAGPDVAIPLRRQRPLGSRRPAGTDDRGGAEGVAPRLHLVTSSGEPMGTDGWGESDVEEIVEALEKVHADRAGAAERAARAAAWMASEWSWDRHVERLMAHVDAVA